jgi:hypothetical protein
MNIQILHPTKLTLNTDQLKQIVLFESKKGMLKRTAGDKFKKNNIEFEFIRTVIFPENGGKFSTNEELNNNIKTFVENEKINVLEENIIGDSKTGKAAILIVLKNLQSNEQTGVIKYVNSVSRTTVWSQTQFGRESGFQRVSSDGSRMSTVEAENLKIKPLDLIGDDSKRSLSQLQEHILKRARQLVESKQLPEICEEHIKQMFSEISGGQSQPLKGGAIYAQAYNKYLGEILAPMSVITGWLSEGDREKSEKALLSEISYSDMDILFNKSLTENLFDSILEKDLGDRKISVKISSKAGKGASASVKSFDKILTFFKEKDLPAYEDFIKSEKNQKALAAFQIINSNTAIKGPIEVAKYLNIVKEEDFPVLDEIVKNVNIDLTLFNETIKLTKNLYDILQSYKSKPLPNYKPALHLIAAIAKKVCTELNSDPNFSSTMKDLLSRSNLIQVNSNIKIVGEDKQDCQFTSFKVKYPPLFVGNIIADSSGEYSATEIKGRISFKIP